VRGCHGADGQGQRGVAPPLWGPDSFNDGAGMARLSNAANFVHSNMPNGTSFEQPALSPEDAWDVAAFVESQPRPHMAGLDRDFPNRLEKPVDAAYGPYADGFLQRTAQTRPLRPYSRRGEELKKGQWSAAASSAKSAQ
jgi:thiosulfate dehydrogenase